MPDPRVQSLARILVHYSTKIQPGDKAMIWGFPLEPAGTPLIQEIYREVLRAGGHPYTYVNIEGLQNIFFEEADEHQLAEPNPIVSLVLESFDVDFRIGSLTNTRQLTGVDPAKIRTATRANSEAFQTAGARTAAGEHRWVVSRYPTHAMAQDANMSLSDFEDFFYKAVYATDDDPVARWQAVSADQARLVTWLKGKKNITVKGPNVDLTLSIEGRTFLNADGQTNMPDGEIYTGPVEDSVNGWIRFNYPVIWSGREVEGAELYFEAGRVVKATANKEEAFLLSILDTDPGARYAGEFAVGTNWQIDRLTRSMLLDEKMGGTIHMALGAGYPETGSLNKSAIHWDMLCDMRDGGQIVVDGELFYDSGEFKI
jgi:aminopeptidase